MNKLLALALLGTGGYLLYKKFKTPEPEKAEAPPASSPTSSQEDLLSRRMAAMKAAKAAEQPAPTRLVRNPTGTQPGLKTTASQLKMTDQPAEKPRIMMAEVEEEGLRERPVEMLMTVRNLKPGKQVTIFHNLTNSSGYPVTPNVVPLDATHIKPIMVTDRYIQFHNWSGLTESAEFRVVGRIESEPRSNLSFSGLGETIVL